MDVIPTNRHRGRRAFAGALLVAILLCLSLGRAFAQSDLGSVRGTVKDDTGAAIPGAAIEITSTETSQTRQTTSDATGNFSVLSLTRGNYKATATLAGFQQQTVTFELQVSQVKALDFVLKVGSASQTVEVSAAAPLVDTETSSMGETVEGRQLSEIPLNGRNFTQLALLAPGVTKGAYGSVASGVNGNAETFRYSETGGGALSVNGLPPEANNYILDGVDNNESLANALTFFPPVEAMQEFRVNTSEAPAEFGRAGGGVIQATIKSGSNQIHGSAFEFIRNGAVDANPNYFDPTAAILPFQKNQYGGTLGGPILRDKLFLFGDYQATRQKQPDNPAINTVPTAKMRTGDFSELIGSGLTTLPNASYSGCTSVTLANGTVIPSTGSLTAANGGSGAIFDPMTCSQWDYNGQPNVIDPARQNPAAMKYLSVFPLPNYGTSTTIENNYVNVQNEIRNFDDFDARIDWIATSKDTLFGRYSYGQDIFTKTVSVVGTPSGYAAGSNVNHPRGFVVGETHTFTPAIINEFRFGYTRPLYGYINPFEGEAFSANLGIVNANRSPLLGGGALIGGYNSEISYTGDGGPYEVPQKAEQYYDSLSWSHGRHTFKFGANVIRREVDFFQGNNAKGFFNIGPGTGDFTGYEASELVAGFVDNYSVSNVNGYFHTHSWETGYFAQDDWKVNDRLVLNLGLRYDLYTWPIEDHDYQSNFDLSTGTLLRAGANGSSRSLIDTNYNNFAPRIGFAYDLSGQHKDVLRGGYGMFYYQVRGGVGNVLSNNPEFNGTVSYSAFSGYRVAFTGQVPKYSNDNTLATAALPVPTFGSTDVEANPTDVNVISYSKKDPTSMIQEWNLQFEHQFGADTVFDLAYVGAKADHETNTYTYSNPQLGTGVKFFGPQGLGVTVNTNNGSFHYNGLQARLNRNMSHGLQTTVAYTWSHALDNATGAYSATGASTILMTADGPLFSANKGNSDNDQRQAVTVSILYELPFGRGRQFGAQMPRAVDYIIGGWQLNPFWSAGSGTPYNITVNPVNTSGPSDRPDIIGNAENGHTSRASNGYIQWFNPAAFTRPSMTADNIYTRPGTLARNTFAGPGYDTLTASLFKNIPIWERVVTQLRFEGYNLLNHPQFTNPDAGFTDTNFGLINSTRQHSERELQGAIRITF